MLLVEMSLPRYVHNQLASRARRWYKDAVKNLVRDIKSSTTFVFLEESPRGWWVALRILREGTGKLYMVREIKYMDVPSKIMELSFEEKWDPKYNHIIEEELNRWGLKNE